MCLFGSLTLSYPAEVSRQSASRAERPKHNIDHGPATSGICIDPSSLGLWLRRPLVSQQVSGPIFPARGAIASQKEICDPML